MTMARADSAVVTAIMDAADRKRDDHVAMLRDLVRFPSVINTPYTPIQEDVMGRLGRLDSAVEVWEPDVADLLTCPWFTPLAEHYPEGFRDRPMVVGRVGSGQGRSLILNGHVDVVPAEPLGRWSVDPWSGDIRDGRLYGRGAIDCKGGLAAAIAAVECLRDADVRVAGQVIIESAIDQEIGGAGTMSSILRGIRADAAITTEPTSGRMALASAGVAWVRVIVTGLAAHAARTWDGHNALNLALPVHDRVRRWGEGREATVRHPLYGEHPVHASFNPGTFMAGGYPSTVPDRAVLEYRIGLVPGERVEDVLAELRQLVEEAAELDPWLRKNRPAVEVFGWYGEATEIGADHPLTRVASEAFREVKGQAPRYVGYTAACDMGKLQHLGGMPVLNLGCDGGGWHQNDEYARLDDYADLIKILALTIVTWCR